MTIVNAETGEILEAEVLPDGLAPPELARIANEHHRLAGEAHGSMVEHALYAGEALTAAKAQLRHGEFGSWLAVNFTGSHSIANKYMKLAANSERVTNLEEPTLRKALEAVTEIRDANASQVTNNSGDNEWFTPAQYIEAARAVMGGIDLDPASTEEANEIVRATMFYSPADDGLVQPWTGRVWMNPPYTAKLVRPFCERLTESYNGGDVTEACVLVNSATETGWFHTLAAAAAGMCFPLRRVQFWHPGKDGAAGPLQGQTVFYLGEQLARFRAEFGQFGFTVTL